MSDIKNNTGEENTGNSNSGYWNSGYWNSGYSNSGYWNSGDRNSGNSNSGYWNSGYWNSGDRNSGDRNSGYWNSGNGNSGNGNSGNGNSGNGNSGNGNSTNRESGIFCNIEDTVRIFNKESFKKWDEIDHPNYNEFYLCKWIPESEMTEAEKKADPQFFVRRGYLKIYEYKEAWVNFWRDTDEENRKKFLNLPNFDAEIFKDITGIDIGENKPKNPEEIIINGATYLLKK